MKKPEWEYCECGCHGHGLSIGTSAYYWMFNDLQGNFSVYEGHGFYGRAVGRYKSFKDADKGARSHVKNVIKELASVL